MSLQLISELSGITASTLHSRLCRISARRVAVLTCDLNKNTNVQLYSIDDNDTLVATDILKLSNMQIVDTSITAIDDDHVCISTYCINEDKISVTIYSVKDCVFDKLCERSIDTHGTISVSTLVLSKDTLVLYYVNYNYDNNPYVRFVIYSMTEDYQLIYQYTHRAIEIETLVYRIVKLNDTSFGIVYGSRSCKLYFKVLKLNHDAKEITTSDEFCIVDDYIVSVNMVKIKDNHILIKYQYGFISHTNVLLMLKINGSTSVIDSIKYDEAAISYFNDIIYNEEDNDLYSVGAITDNKNISYYVGRIEHFDISVKLVRPKPILITAYDTGLKHISSCYLGSGKFLIYLSMVKEPYSSLQLYVYDSK